MMLEDCNKTGTENNRNQSFSIANLAGGRLQYFNKRAGSYSMAGKFSGDTESSTDAVMSSSLVTRYYLFAYFTE
jgi:hypothetical protein